MSPCSDCPCHVLEGFPNRSSDRNQNGSHINQNLKEKKTIFKLFFMIRLENFRVLLSNFLHENIKFQDLELRLRNQPLLDKIRRMNPLTVGQIVMTIHPICKHFHSGAVLTANIEHNIIKFFTNELGVQKIKDSRICVEVCQGKEGEQQEDSPNNSNGENYRDTGNENNTNASANEEGIVQDIDLFAMGFLLKMLDRYLSVKLLVILSEIHFRF
jgi:hypothetical protein